jgi:hypothetical protein
MRAADQQHSPSPPGSASHSRPSGSSLSRMRISDRSGIGDLGGHPLPYGGFEGIGSHQVDGSAEMQ